MRTLLVLFLTLIYLNTFSQSKKAIFKYNHYYNIENHSVIPTDTVKTNTTIVLDYAGGCISINDYIFYIYKMERIKATEYVYFFRYEATDMNGDEYIFHIYSDIAIIYRKGKMKLFLNY